MERSWQWKAPVEQIFEVVAHITHPKQSVPSKLFFFLRTIKRQAQSRDNTAKSSEIQSFIED